MLETMDVSRFITGRGSNVRTIATSQHAIMLPNFVALALLFLSLDYFGLISEGPPLRYPMVLLALVATAYIDFRHTPFVFRLSPILRIALLVLCLWCVIGPALALAASDWNDTTAVIATAPLVLATVLAAELRRPPLTHYIGRPTLLYWAACAFMATSVWDATISTASSDIFLNHEKTFVALYILGLPNNRLTVFTKLGMVVSLILSFATYPTATSVVAVILAAMTALIVSSERSARKPLIVAGALALVPVLIYGPPILERFYSLTNRADNSETRQALWDAAVRVIDGNWVLGGWFTAPITAPTDINGTTQFTPFHNSWLTLTTAGGLLLTGAVIIVAALVVWKGLTRRLLGASYWCPALVAALWSMSINPIPDKLGLALFVYVVLAQGALSAHAGLPLRDQKNHNMHPRPRPDAGAQQTSKLMRKVAGARCW